MASPAASSEGNSSLTVSSSVLKLTVAAEETEREGGKEGGREGGREVGETETGREVRREGGDMKEKTCFC